MSITAKVTIDTRAVTRALTDLERRQIPFATAKALNALGKLALADLRAEMVKVLDRPTPYTLGAFGLKPATKSDQVATIGVKKPTSGRSAWSYLAPEIMGGPRARKGFELKMTALSGGQYVLPEADTPLDAYGNIRRSFLSQVQASLDATGQPAPAKGKRRAARGARYMVRRAGGKPDGRPIGVFRVDGKGGAVEVLGFTKSTPSYEPRLDVEGVVRRSVAANGAAEFDRALAAAIATAK